MISGASDREVAAVILDKIAAGLLPRETPLKVWAGRGRGRVCDGCERQITADEVEHELDFSGGRTLRLHAACSDIWRRATAEDAKSGVRTPPPRDGTTGLSIP